MILRLALLPPQDNTSSLSSWIISSRCCIYGAGSSSYSRVSQNLAEFVCSSSVVPTPTPHNRSSLPMERLRRNWKIDQHLFTRNDSASSIWHSSGDDSGIDRCTCSDRSTRFKFFFPLQYACSDQFCQRRLMWWIMHGALDILPIPVLYAKIWHNLSALQV